MPIPDYQTLMLPVLELAAKKNSECFTSRDALSAVVEKFHITDQEKNELIGSRRQTILMNRIYWATIYLNRAGLIVKETRGNYKITERGKDVLKQKPEKITWQFLEQFEGFKEWRRSYSSGSVKVSSEAESENEKTTPEETLNAAYKKVRANLTVQLKEKLRDCSPEFFEQLVVDLLVKMGYGGTRSDAGRAVGKSGDGGIDGIIKEDKLGLDTIYLQAKRWNGATVSRSDIQQFAGALQAQKASKGVFITTSRFSADATDYVTKIGSKIVLIDGEQLAELMIDHNLGVSVKETYEIKEVDNDYFTE
jgi:restriction system protein